MFSDTKSCITLNHLFADLFLVNIGVKKGNNLSPTIFGLYTNSLAVHIKNLHKGSLVRLIQREYSDIFDNLVIYRD